MNTPVRKILIVLSVTVVVAFILTLFNYDDCGFSGKYQFSGSDGETTSDVFTIDNNAYYQILHRGGEGDISIDVYRDDALVRPITYDALNSNTSMRQLGESGDYYLVVNSSGINWKILIWDIVGTL